MTPLALTLVTISTFTHAGWNYMGKRRSPSAAFFLMASLAALAVLSPLLFFYARAIALIPPWVWALLLLTGVCQATYYAALAGAYRFGDLSVAYPLARALPVLLVMLITTLLGLGKPISLIGYVGIFTVAAGCLFVPIPHFREFRPSSYLNLCCAMAALAACGTTGYTIIDSVALAQLRALPQLRMNAVEISILYIFLETAATALMLGGYVLLRSHERASFQAMIHTGWGYAAVTGLIITGTYGLVLAAMAYTTNVSYLAAFRQLSIPLGALLGISLQKEPAFIPKIVGVGIVLAGLVLIGIA